MSANYGEEIVETTIYITNGFGSVGAFAVPSDSTWERELARIQASPGNWSGAWRVEQRREVTHLLADDGRER